MAKQPRERNGGGIATLLLCEVSEELRNLPHLRRSVLRRAQQRASQRRIRLDLHVVQLAIVNDTSDRSVSRQPQGDLVDHDGLANMASQQLNLWSLEIADPKA